MSDSGSSSNVARYLTQTALEQPRSTALSIPLKGCTPQRGRYRTLDFEQLEELAGLSAAYLIRRGVNRGDRVLLLVRPGLELILCVFALFRLGAVPVVIDPGMGLRAFLRCVRQSTPDVLLAIAPGILVSRLFPGAFKDLRLRIRVDNAWSMRVRRGVVEPVSPVTTGPDELAAILFTSGSTGPAKGVRYTHGMFDAQVRMLDEVYRFAKNEVDLPMLPIFALFNPAFGMTTVVPEMNPGKPAKADPARIVRAIQENRVTNSFGSPTLWRNVADYCEERGLKLSSVNRILMAGAPAPSQLLDRLKKIVPDGEIFTPYGATECLPVSTISATEILRETARWTHVGRGTCVGHPVPGVTIRIVSVVDGELTDDLVRELPGEEIGEILVTGPSVTREYDRLEEATRLSKWVDRDGRTWHRMGDLGYRDAGGRLWFCGRVAERVVTADRVYYTECCEPVFNAHADLIQRSALIAWQAGPDSPVEPAIVIERPDGRELDRDFLRLAADDCPATRGIRRFYFHKSFPVDVRHNAKINRRLLAREFMGRSV